MVSRDRPAVRQRSFALEEVLLGQASDQGADRIGGETQFAGPQSATQMPGRLEMSRRSSLWAVGQRLGGPRVPDCAPGGPSHCA